MQFLSCWNSFMKLSHAAGGIHPWNGPKQQPDWEYNSSNNCLCPGIEQVWVHHAQKDEFLAADVALYQQIPDGLLRPDRD